MISVLERLRKVLSLEQRQGYRDQAVIRGMAAFAERWEADALKAAGEAEYKAFIVQIIAKLRSYSSIKDQAARLQIIDDMLALAASAAEAVQQSTSNGTAAVAEAAGADAAPSPPPAPARPTTAPQGRRAASSKARARTAFEESMGLDAPVSRLPTVGPRHSRHLERLGVRTINDLLYLFPRRYDDYSRLKTIDRLEYGEDVTIIGNIWDVTSREARHKNLTIVEAIVGDATGTIQATWFNPYIGRQLRPGRSIVLSGRIDARLGRLVMTSPAWEPLDKELIHTGRLVPVYPLTEGIGGRWLRELVRQATQAWAPRLPEHVPAEVLERAGLLSLGRALEQIHFPDNLNLLDAARRRLAFDEFFLIQIGAMRMRAEWRRQPGRALEADAAQLDQYMRSLPFVLTQAQGRAVVDVSGDLSRSEPMNRLLQGDVGSGKTVVAGAAIWTAVCNGAQAAVMAPTEILAEQHHRTFSALFGSLPHPRRPGALRVAMLIGSQKPEEKEAARQAIAAGEVDVAVGTHALIQESVAFQDLALVVIDEQHRFGVRQRAALRGKGYHPHVLVMSATPIPRSLALTVYGDLDLTTIDELPAGRRPIRTRWIRPYERERAYAFVRSQVAEGRQAFVICPLVEESEVLDAKAAVDEHLRLQKDVFPDLQVGLLHGRMKGEEKEAVMRSFRQGDLQILVSTSVVEVGIDVPNATVMLVEGAERFGLAQLHQFRGRVGRGEHQSYCLLMSEAAEGDAVERLQALVESDDGFVLAEKDLELRGPGDFLGTRQSGLPVLRLAKLSDLRTLELARTEAKRLLDQDPELAQPEDRPLARQVDRFWKGQSDLS